MKPKYSQTYAELTKLQNQIRVELNRVRPSHEIMPLERREKSSKRHYRQKYSQTSVCEPPEERSQQETTPTKRFYQKDKIVHENQNKSRQRKHFDNSYTDKVKISTPITRKTSAYLNVIKIDKENQKDEPHHTSLYGIGQKDKSLNTRAKQGKRIFASKHTKPI